MNSLHQTCDRLRIENLNLKGRQDMIRDMVQSWAPETHSTAPPLTPAFLGHSEHVAHRVGSSSSHTTFVSNYGDTVESAVPEGAHLTCQCSSEEPGSGQAAAVGNLVSTNGVLPPWKQIPVHDKDDIIVTDWFALWLNKPELARASPDSPRPIDILYGSKENFLANVLHLTSRKWPCRDPERLASGWLAYHLIKWMLEPTEKTFSRLCEFQRPVAEQFRYPHPYHIDFVVWPGLRANCVDYQYTYSCEQVAGMLTCCVKVRSPFCRRLSSFGTIRCNTDESHSAEVALEQAYP